VTVEAVTAIERAIRGRAQKLQPRWELEQAIAFGKLALQVALEGRARWENRSRDAEFKHFRVAASLAKKAHQALQVLLNHIGPSGLQKAIAPTLIARNREVQLRISEGDSKKRADTLAAASSLIEEMHRYAKQHAATKPPAPNYGKRAFVYHLAEGWIFLFGDPPGGGRVRAGNPFLCFVEDAASDAGVFKADEDFYSSLKWVLTQLARHEACDEKGETRQSISGIRTRGPVWLESTSPPVLKLGGVMHF
jgi:hypothetical protein